MIDALVRVYELTGRARWITIAAIETADAMIELFRDDVNGGLFTTGTDGERLIARPKETHGQRGTVGQQHGRHRAAAPRRAHWRRSLRATGR